MGDDETAPQLFPARSKHSTQRGQVTTGLIWKAGPYQERAESCSPSQLERWWGSFFFGSCSAGHANGLQTTYEDRWRVEVKQRASSLVTFGWSNIRMYPVWHRLQRPTDYTEAHQYAPRSPLPPPPPRPSSKHHHQAQTSTSIPERDDMMHK